MQVNEKITSDLTWNRRVKTSWMRTLVLVSSLETTSPGMEKSYQLQKSTVCVLSSVMTTTSPRES